MKKSLRLWTGMLINLLGGYFFFTKEYNFLLNIGGIVLIAISYIIFESLGGKNETTNR